jgi:hypothetical protein
MRAAVLISLPLLFASVPFLLTPAEAADLPALSPYNYAAPSNYPALGVDPNAPAPDPWAGLSLGAGVSVWGGKGVKGGVGGETDLTYQHVFENGVMLGVQGSTGYMPYLTAGPGYSQFTGGAYAGASAIAGYSFGDVTPYVIAGVDFLRSTRYGVSPFSAGDSMNAVFSGPGALQAVGTFGVGVNYRINSNFSMGFEALVRTNPGSGYGASWPP